MLGKIMRHAREGTLVEVTKTRLRLMANRGPGDRFYGDRASNYEAKRQGQEFWDEQQRIAEELIGGFPDGIKVLDVPFGTGRFVDLYNRKHMEVSGLEISEDMVQAARDARGDAMAGYDVRIGDARELPWPDDTFDLVASYRFLSSIISIADARIVLRELQRVSRGHVIVDVGIRDETAPPRRRAVRDSEMAGVLLDEREVREMIEGAGLEVVSITPQYRWTDEGHRCAVVCRSTPSS